MTESAQNLDPDRCMKCGFCMSACPVYQVDLVETHVARGRNVLIRLANEDKIATEDSYEKCLDHCLLCGQCLAVCPAQVPSPAINIEARRRLLKTKGLALGQRFIYRGILKHRPLMARLMGLASLVPGVSRKHGKPIRHMADIMSIFSGGISIPRLTRPFLSKRLEHKTLPPNGTPSKGRVAFFPGCGFEFFFSHIGVDTALALARTGFEVIYPPGQTCCGMAIHNAGDFDTARLMAERNVEILWDYDYIVTGCATCGSTLKDYGNWFTQDDTIRQKAVEVSGKVFDFSEFLVNQGFSDESKKGRPSTVTFHDPCHLKCHQGISNYPREIIRSLKGVEFIEMEGAGSCCGLGGTFGISHREISLAIQAKKMKYIEESGAQAVVTACPGCLIQLMDGVRRHDLSVDVLHLSQLIVGPDTREN